MPVKKDPSGRRSGAGGGRGARYAQAGLQAIAHRPASPRGSSQPSPRPRRRQMICHFGPGNSMDSVATITALEPPPPHRRQPGHGPQSPVVATEWTSRPGPAARAWSASSTLVRSTTMGRRVRAVRERLAGVLPHPASSTWPTSPASLPPPSTDGQRRAAAPPGPPSRRRSASPRHGRPAVPVPARRRPPSPARSSTPARRSSPACSSASTPPPPVSPTCSPCPWAARSSSPSASTSTATAPAPPRPRRTRMAGVDRRELPDAGRAGAQRAQRRFSRGGDGSILFECSRCGHRLRRGSGAVAANDGGRGRDASTDAARDPVENVGAGRRPIARDAGVVRYGGKVPITFQSRLRGCVPIRGGAEVRHRPNRSRRGVYWHAHEPPMHDVSHPLINALRSDRAPGDAAAAATGDFAGSEAAPAETAPAPARGRQPTLLRPAAAARAPNP